MFVKFQVLKVGNSICNEAYSQRPPQRYEISNFTQHQRRFKEPFIFISRGL